MKKEKGSHGASICPAKSVIHQKILMGCLKEVCNLNFRSGKNVFE